MAHKRELISDFDLGIPYTSYLNRKVVDGLKRFSGIDGLNGIYWAFDELRGGGFVRAVLERQGVRGLVSELSMSNIAQQGGMVVVANRPYGILDTLLVMDLVLRKRQDLRFIGNFIVSQVAPLSDYFIEVDPFTPTSEGNLGGIRSALEHVRGGGVLVVFPSMDVATHQSMMGNVNDSAWSKSTMKFVKMCGVPVLPLFIAGGNSARFHWLGKVHPMLRVAQLPREFLRKTNVDIELKVGTPFLVADQVRVPNLETYSNFIRSNVYLLGERNEALPLQDEASEIGGESLRTKGKGKGKSKGKSPQGHDQVEEMPPRAISSQEFEALCHRLDGKQIAEQGALTLYMIKATDLSREELLASPQIMERIRRHEKSLEKSRDMMFEKLFEKAMNTAKNTANKVSKEAAKEKTRHAAANIDETELFGVDRARFETSSGPGAQYGVGGDGRLSEADLAQRVSPGDNSAQGTGLAQDSQGSDLGTGLVHGSQGSAQGMGLAQGSQGSAQGMGLAQGSQGSDQGMGLVQGSQGSDLGTGLAQDPQFVKKPFRPEEFSSFLVILDHGQRTLVVGSELVMGRDLFENGGGLEDFRSYGNFEFSRKLTSLMRSSIEVTLLYLNHQYTMRSDVLKLLWGGILKVSSQNPWCENLIGVSHVSQHYSLTARMLIMSYLKSNAWNDSLSRLVVPRHDSIKAMINDNVEQVVALVETSISGVLIDKLLEDLVVEPGELSRMPLMLKRYLAMGGEVISLNVDSDNALDMLLLLKLGR